MLLLAPEGRKICSHARKGVVVNAWHTDSPGRGGTMDSRRGLLSPLPGLRRCEGIPAAYAAGYKSWAPPGRKTTLRPMLTEEFPLSIALSSL